MWVHVFTVRRHSFCQFLFCGCKTLQGHIQWGNKNSIRFRHPRISPGVPRLPGPLIKAKRGSRRHRTPFVHSLDAMTVVGKKKKKERMLVDHLASNLDASSLLQTADIATKRRIVVITKKYYTGYVPQVSSLQNQVSTSVAHCLLQ